VAWNSNKLKREEILGGGAAGANTTYFPTKAGKEKKRKEIGVVLVLCALIRKLFCRYVICTQIVYTMSLDNFFFK
jgi:esterase/lipase superfamily enzyme